MKLVNFIQARGLALIMILFFLTGLTGIFVDYPLNTGGDESVLTAAAVKMISDRTLRPNYLTFYHVPLAVYFYLPPFILFFIFLRLSGAFTSLDSLKEFGLVNFYNFLPFARLLTVLMGLASIYILFRIAQKLFNNKAISLAAAFFLSFSFMFMQLAHLARVWLPQTLTVLIAFYFIIILYQSQRDKFKNYLLVALSLGLAFGTHVVGIMVYAPFLLVHYLRNKAKKIKEIFLIDKYFWLANVAIIICYLSIFYLNPYGFKNYINRQGKIWPSFNLMLESGAVASSGGAAGSLFFKVIDFFREFGYYAVVLIEYDPILILFFIMGVFALFFKEREKFYLIISFILTYYFGITLVGLVPYYILPIIPFLALVAGYGLYNLYKKIKTRINQPVALAIIFFVLILNFTPLMLWNYRLIQPGARLAARDWVYKNISAGSSIINFDTLLELNENKDSLADIKRLAGNFYTKKREYLLSGPAGEYAWPSYYVVYFDYFKDWPKELLNKKYDYLIISWKNKEELKTMLNQAKSLKLKASLLKRFPASAKENDDYKDWRDMPKPLYTIMKDNIRGPIVDIYKLE